MAVYLTVEYKAQLIVDLTSEGRDLLQAGIDKTSDFDLFIKNLLAEDAHKGVKIDPQYKRYGLDIGLVSESKEQLSAACYDIANYTQEQPYLNDIFFECFDD